MKRTIAFLLVLVMCLSLCACGKSQAVKNVEQLIDNIGDVSLNSKTTIASAQEAYEALTDKERGTVQNYQKLETAIKDFKELSYQVDITDFILRLDAITMICDTNIDFYSTASRAISGAAKCGESMNYSDCLKKTFQGATWSDLPTWKQKQGAYWDLELFLLGTILYSDNKQYDWNSYSSFNSYAFITNDSYGRSPRADKFDFEKDAPVIFTRATAYAEAMSKLEDYEKNDNITLEMLMDLKDTYGDIHKNQIDALQQWYLAVSDGINYVRNSTGSLSSIVNGWESKKADILQAEKLFNLS